MSRPLFLHNQNTFRSVVQIEKRLLAKPNPTLDQVGNINLNCLSSVAFSRARLKISPRDRFHYPGQKLASDPWAYAW